MMTQASHFLLRLLSLDYHTTPDGFFGAKKLIVIATFYLWPKKQNDSPSVICMIMAHCIVCQER